MELTKTVERIKKIITKGLYERESLLLDLNDFLELGTIYNESYTMLLEMMPALETADSTENIEDTNTYSNTSDTTYLLLKKQITKQVYSESAIKQMVTDFRITSTITRPQFTELKNLIESIYNPEIDYETDIEGDI